MEIFGEDEASTLMKEMKRICQVFAKKEIETLFLSFDMNDKSSQIFGSSVGMTFLQHLVLIEKFQKFCEDAYVTRNVYATCTYEKEENTGKSLKQTEETNEDINPDDTDQMDSFEISNTLKIENEESKKQKRREREDEIKLRFPITPRITRSVARKQEKSCSTNKTKSSDNIKTTKISEMVHKVRDNRKGTKMKWRKKEKPNKKEMTDNEKEYDREKKEGVNKLEIKDKKKEYDRQKKDGVYKLKRKKEKECEREMVEENDTDKETNKENKMDDSAVFLHGGKTNKEYVCKICHEMFEKYSNFQDHVRDLKHFQDQNLRCNVCDTFFTNMRSLGQHRNILQHYLKCEICGKYFTRMKAFGIHQRFHKREKRNLKKKIEHDKKEKIFKCEICNESFSTTKGLGQHRYRYRHYHKCKDCGKRFSRKKIFDNHCRKHENKPRKWKQKKDIPKEHQCSICGKMFNKSYPLRIHIRYHTGEKPYMCDLCGKVTASKTELNMHKLIHTNERPYPCDICKKSFRMLNKLKRHQIVHTGLKPHKCSECGKCFTTASNMRTHVKNIHMGIKEFACDICNIKFAHSSNMRAHIRGVHKKKEIEEPKNKNEILNLLKSKEYDMNSVTMVTTIGKEKTEESKLINSNERGYKDKDKEGNNCENIKDRNLLNEINSNSKKVIQIVPKHGPHSSTHAEITTISEETEIKNGSRCKNYDQNVKVIGTSLKEENDNLKDLSESRLYIDESSVSRQMKISEGTPPVEISNQTITETENQPGGAKKWCSQNNVKDLQAQEGLALKRPGLHIKNMNVYKAVDNQFQGKDQENERRDLKVQEGSSSQEQAPENSENELKSHEIDIVVQGSDKAETENGLKSGRQIIEVIQIPTQILDEDEVLLQSKRTVSWMEKHDNNVISDSQIQDEFELQIQEQVVSESEFNFKEQLIEEKNELDRQEQVTSGVELQHAQQHLIDGVELESGELVVGRDLIQNTRQDRIVLESKEKVIDGMVLQIHGHGEDGVELQDGGKCLDMDLPKNMENVEDVEFQTTEHTSDIELQMEEEIVGDSEVEMQEEIIHGAQIQEQTIDGVQLQEQTIDSVYLQEQTIESVNLQEQTIDSVQVEEHSIEGLKEQTLDSLQVQEQTIGSEQDEGGTIIQLNPDSEIHVVYQPEYGEIGDNMPHLIYLYPTK